MGRLLNGRRHRHGGRFGRRCGGRFDRRQHRRQHGMGRLLNGRQHRMDKLLNGQRRRYGGQLDRGRDGRRAGMRWREGRNGRGLRCRHLVRWRVEHPVRQQPAVRAAQIGHFTRGRPVQFPAHRPQRQAHGLVQGLALEGDHGGLVQLAFHHQQPAHQVPAPGRQAQLLHRRPFYRPRRLPAAMDQAGAAQDHQAEPQARPGLQDAVPTQAAQ